MAIAGLQAVVRHCDLLLNINDVPDYDGAFNGLQVENRGRVSRVAAAVDASPTTVKLAVEAKANLLLVHHGLFWGNRHPWTGTHYQLMRQLLENDVAVYSAHLPLDMHPKLGNNALLCSALGLRTLKPFFFQRERHWGFRAAKKITRRRLVTLTEKAVNGPVHLIPGGPPNCRKIGVVSGGAGGELAVAAAEGVDTFITGEGPHWTFALAEELGVNVLYAGHYATETFGVKALAEHLARRFKLSWTFLDHPTGL
jgi:dinuclear metal center YbgI/SA1388 family protein